MCQLCVTGRFQEQVGTAWKDRQFARQFFSKVLYIERERDWALDRICARALTFENVYIVDFIQDMCTILLYWALTSENSFLC